MTETEKEWKDLTKTEKIIVVIIFPFLILFTSFLSLIMIVKRKREKGWRYYETDLVCEHCENYLYYREPKSYDPKNDEVEYLFLDQVYCTNCEKSFLYLDAFFYSLPERKLNNLGGS